MEPYYRSLLSINVGDTIIWRIDGKGQRMRGIVKAAYPNGNGQYCTSQDAYFHVAGHHTGRTYSVPYDNPTIQKVETTPCQNE